MDRRQVDGVVLSQRYESQLFSSSSCRHNRVVPVLVITGFLGSGSAAHAGCCTTHTLGNATACHTLSRFVTMGGLTTTTASAAANCIVVQLINVCRKTTLVAHLLQAAGQELKLGVLVNEVACVDVDGQLLSTARSNAAAGIKSSAQLAGGCACCSVSSNLQGALHELAGSSSYQQLDYLVRLRLRLCVGAGRSGVWGALVLWLSDHLSVLKAYGTDLSRCWILPCMTPQAVQLVLV